MSLMPLNGLASMQQAQTSAVKTKKHVNGSNNPIAPTGSLVAPNAGFAGVLNALTGALKVNSLSQSATTAQTPSGK